MLCMATTNVLTVTAMLTVQNELGATLSLYLTYIHTSRKLVVAASFQPERVERRPAPAAPSMPADSTPAIPNPNPNLRSGKTDEVARRPAPAAPSIPSDTTTTTAAATSGQAESKQYMNAEMFLNLT